MVVFEDQAAVLSNGREQGLQKFAAFRLFTQYS